MATSRRPRPGAAGLLVAVSIAAAAAFGPGSAPASVDLAPGQEAAEGRGRAAGPVAYTYSRPDGVELSAHVFSPLDGAPDTGPRSAILVFHGGGWTIGEAAWAFPQATFFAERGMVGIAVQYRLSGPGSATPIEAMADARAAFRWARAEAEMLGIDPTRVAGYGWSAGAHLIASAAIFDELPPPGQTSPSPDAMILLSPAVAVGGDGWFQRLLGGRADADELSPHLHVRAGLPPALVLQGDVDTVTPLFGVSWFCEAMRDAGNTCEMRLYEGYGHLFTPAGIPDDGWPEPDPEVRQAALDESAEFLRGLGFIGQPRTHRE